MPRLRPPIECWCGGACPHLATALDLERQNRPRLAEIELHRVLSDAPSCWQAHSVLARVLGGNNRADAGVDHVDWARASAGDLPVLMQQRAALLWRATEIPAAIDSSQIAVAQAPNSPEAAASLLSALDADGRQDEALAFLAQCDVRFLDRKAYRRIAALVEAYNDPDAAMRRLSADDLTPTELFDRGRLKEKRADYAGAWSDWMTAQARLRAQGCVYDVEGHRREIADLYEMASPNRQFWLKPCAPLKRGPIFITGFPRSGTTMVEATLSAHAAIVAGDELPFVDDVIERLPMLLRAGTVYPRALMASAWMENAGMLELARDLYVAKARAKIGHAGDTRWFTDKMLSNEKHLLLLSLLFPASPIFHVRRHPLDIMISNMSHWLMHGRYASCSPEWFAENFEQIDSLVSFYRDMLPDLRFFEVRYEQFVANHVDTIDAMLNFVGLKPEPACYDFHLSPWRSRTISYRQIKEPVHARSVRRYEPFLEFLKPVLPLLMPAIARHGYSV